MMKFVLAPDSYKESASAKEICLAMEAGIRRVFPEAEIVHVPMADGGEGSTESLVDATEGEIIYHTVRGPLGAPVEGMIGIHGDQNVAIIEMASASGLQLIDPHVRNPMLTSTYGTGQLIAECLNRGIEEIIIGIGGSATNDGGAGMAQALGYRFLDVNGQEVDCCGGNLDLIVDIDSSQVHSKLASCQIRVASDVQNPLTGPEGASAIFGPQKGADSKMVEQLDKNLSHFAQVIRKALGKDIEQVSGSGAAGGLGGLLAFTSSQMHRGIDLIIETTRFKEKVQGADIVFTGEGRMDYQTKYGKTPFGVMQATKSVDPNIKVIGISGCLGDRIEDLYESGFDGIFSVIPSLQALESLYENTGQNVANVVEAVCRVMK